MLLQQNPEIRGVRAATMRAVARNLWLIDEEFRQNPRHHRLFLEILRAPRGRHPRAAAHEQLRRARPLHSGLRPHRRAHAVRPVPCLHGGCAHAVRGEQPAALRDRRVTTTSCREVSRDHAAAAASPRSPTSRRCSTTSPRGAAAITPSSARWMPRRSASSRGCRATTRAWSPGWCATTSAVDHRAEAGHRRPAGHQRLRAQGRRRDAPRLPVRAHLRGRARHQPEAVEFLEGIAVPRVLRARQARAAPRARDARSTRRTWCARPRTRRARLLLEHGVGRSGASSASGRASRPRYFLQHSARGDRLAHARCSPSATPPRTSRWWRSSRAACAAPPQC